MLFARSTYREFKLCITDIVGLSYSKFNATLVFWDAVTTSSKHDACPLSISIEGVKRTALTDGCGNSTWYEPLTSCNKLFFFVAIFAINVATDPREACTLRFVRFDPTSYDGEIFVSIPVVFDENSKSIPTKAGGVFCGVNSSYFNPIVERNEWKDGAQFGKGFPLLSSDHIMFGRKSSTLNHGFCSSIDDGGEDDAGSSDVDNFGSFSSFNVIVRRPLEANLED